jgi:ArsR family transcriptional regulator
MKTLALPLSRAANLFRLLGDVSRLRLLLALDRHGTLNVSALCAALGKSQPAVSRHLRLLRCAGVVRSRREGASHVYSLGPGHVRALLRMVRKDDAGPPQGS